VASTVVPGARSVPYPCTASRISHFQRHQSIIETERERERDRHVPFNDKTIGGSHTHNHRLMFVARPHLSIRQEIHRQYNPRSCAARRYCGVLSTSTRHKYLLGCMILSWTRSASSQGNHIDDSSSSSHSPSAEMVVTHRWNPCESRRRHLLIRRAHHRSPRYPTHRQQYLESRLRRGSFHADADTSCLRLGSGAVRLVGAGDNQLDCARLVSLTTVDDIQLVDQTNVALAIVPTSSNDGDRFSLCCQTRHERERERESIKSTYTCVADERQTHSTLGKTRCARSSNGDSIQQLHRCQCDRRTTTLLMLVLQSMTHWPAGNLLCCERSRSYASCLSVLGLNECLTCANVSTTPVQVGAESPHHHEHTERYIVRRGFLCSRRFIRSDATQTPASSRHLAMPAHRGSVLLCFFVEMLAQSYTNQMLHHKRAFTHIPYGCCIACQAHTQR